MKPFYLVAVILFALGACTTDRVAYLQPPSTTTTSDATAVPLAPAHKTEPLPGRSDGPPRMLPMGSMICSATAIERSRAEDCEQRTGTIDLSGSDSELWKASSEWAGDCYRRAQYLAGRYGRGMVCIVVMDGEVVQSAEFDDTGRNVQTLLHRDYEAARQREMI